MNKLFVFLVVLYFGLTFDRLNIFKYCILSSCLHELGHIVAYSLFMKKLPNIDVSAFGFRMKNDASDSRYYNTILLSGPLVNLFICISCLILLKNGFNLNLYVLMTVNIVIFIMNLLPVYYMDGGNIMYNKSIFYQRNHRKISIFSVIILSVMVISFTDNIMPFFIFLFYFILNLINDN